MVREVPMTILCVFLSLNGDPEYKLSILIVWPEVFPRAKSFDVSPERPSLLAFFSCLLVYFLYILKNTHLIFL